MGGKSFTMPILYDAISHPTLRPYAFYGTNAYWAQMATDEDIDITFHDIATLGFSVVRVWAFNDVHQKPSTGVYFQVTTPRPRPVTSQLIPEADSEKRDSHHQRRCRWPSAT